MSPPERSGSYAIRYGGALACVVVALIARTQFASLTLRAPYFMTYVAVLVAARYFCRGPSILAVLAGTRGTRPLPRRGDWQRLTRFGIVTSRVVWIVAVSRRARADAERNAALAQERLAQLEIEAVRRAREERLSSQLRAIVESSEDAIVSKDL